MSALRNLVSGVVGGASGRGKASAADTPAAPSSPSKKKETVLVVGGAGFLGRHIVRQLLEHPRFRDHVRVFDLRDPQIAGVERAMTGDLRKAEDVVAAVEGCDVVIHVATATPTSENALDKELMDGVNVRGTYNVVEACRHAGVRRLVYTSSASVVFTGEDLDGVDEANTPYAAKPHDHYTATKIEGERIVLAANGARLATCALRPSGIFGEGDTVMVPTMVRQAKAGKMKYIIGSGRNLWDLTYVGNVAQAHVQAAERLDVGSPAAGEAFFITNQEPVPFWSFTGDLLEGLGYERPSRRLPLGLVLTIAMIFEYVIRPLLSPIVKLSSDFTVFRVRIVTRQRAFCGDKARRLLGYVPRVSVREGLERTVAHFAHLRKGAPEGGGGGGAAAGGPVTRGKARKD
jgi:sterol-4alpha-carboxylate 3-dehydrogenase (decarboxylating)